MRKSFIAALLACTAITFPLQTTPVLVPGSGFTSDQQSDIDSMQGATSLAGPGTVTSGAVPEYTSYGQIGLTGANGTTPAVPVPNGKIISPCVTDTPYFSDFMLQATGFSCGPQGILGGVKFARCWADGNFIDIAAQAPVPVGLDASRGGTRNIPGYQSVLKHLGPGVKRRIKLYWVFYPHDAMRAQGVLPRVVGPFYMSSQPDYDVKAVIDHNVATSSTVLANGAIYKNETDFITAAVNAWGIQTGKGDPTLYSYASYKDTSGPNTTVDVASFNVNLTTASIGSLARIAIDGGSRAVTIRNVANPTKSTLFRPKMEGLDLIGFKIDFSNIDGFFALDGQTKRSQIIDCDLYSAGNLEVDRFTASARGAMFPASAPLVFVRCTFRDMMIGDNAASTMIGCNMLRLGRDAHNISTLRPNTFIATDCDRLNDLVHFLPRPALTLTYSGPGQPTYDITGIHNGVSPSSQSTTAGTARTITLRVDGQAVYTKSAVGGAGSVTPGVVFTLDNLM